MRSVRHRFQRRYCGPVQAVLLDWAGTVVDYGSRAPAGVFVEIFKRHAITITLAEARAPMGLEKRAHIASIAGLPDVQRRWQQVNRRAIAERDIDQMYEEFVPLQLQCLPRYADLIPGTLDVLASCRTRGIKIGTSTGYARALMDVLVPEAKRRGFAADAVVTADEVPHGRPAPWMCFENATRLRVWPMEAIVVVDDTIPGLEAGLNAGMWTVGVAKSGNELGLSLAEIEALEPADFRRRLDAAYDRLSRCGAHYVVDSVADLMPVIDDIAARLARGEKP
jgi:phosphonoacetaldehyde hydrolase